MTSNTKGSLLRLPVNFRETFGILKRNGERYKDIVSAYISDRIVNVYDLHQGFIRTDDNRIYAIHTDWETFSYIMDNNEAHCVISYQTRTTGRFAMVRLYKTELTNKE